MSRRRPFQPTPDQQRAVEMMAGFGIPHEEIRRAVPDPRTGRSIDEKTLRKHFRDELSNGRAKVKATLCGFLLSRGKNDKSGAVAIFLGKTVLGLKETTVNEVTGKDGEPLDFRTMSDEQLDTLIARLEQSLARPRGG